MTVERYVRIPATPPAIRDAVYRGDFELALIMCRFCPDMKGVHDKLLAIRDAEALIVAMDELREKVAESISETEDQLYSALEGLP